MKIPEILKKIEKTLMKIKTNKITGKTSFEINHSQGGFNDFKRIREDKS